jgi:hypothetical protein
MQVAKNLVIKAMAEISGDGATRVTGERPAREAAE